MTMNDALATKMLAAIAQIEQRQKVCEVVMGRVLDSLDVQLEMTNRLIAEVRGENGGNAITSAITEIRDSSNRQVELLERIYEDTLVPGDSDDRLAAAEELADEADMAAAGIPLPVR